MKKLHKYTIEAWFRTRDFEKECMRRDIIAESPEKALELANLIRRNIFSVKIIKTESYTERISDILQNR